MQRPLDGQERTLSGAQVMFEQKIVQAVEVLVCFPGETDLVSH